MTLKEFLILVREHFLKEHNEHMQDENERWMTEGLCSSVAAVRQETECKIGIKAFTLLETHRPLDSGAWWFPTGKSFGYDVCIAPRLAILNEIITSL